MGPIGHSHMLRADIRNDTDPVYPPGAVLGGRIISGNQLARLGSDVSVQKLNMSSHEALFRMYLQGQNG